METDSQLLLNLSLATWRCALVARFIANLKEHMGFDVMKINLLADWPPPTRYYSLPSDQKDHPLLQWKEDMATKRLKLESSYQIVQLQYDAIVTESGIATIPEEELVELERKGLIFKLHSDYYLNRFAPFTQKGNSTTGSSRRYLTIKKIWQKTKLDGFIAVV